MKKRFDTTILEKLLSSSTRPLLIGHFNPDGDAVGALTAMYHYLRDRGMVPYAVLPSPYPDYLAFLIEEGTPMTIHSREDESARELIASADLLICFDFNRLSRTEHLSPLLQQTQKRKQITRTLQLAPQTKMAAK